MKEIIIAFDVDGTLISNANGLGKERLNVEVYQMLVLFRKFIKNAKIIVWSGGGKDYAEQIVLKYGLGPYVDGCVGKHEHDDMIHGHVDIAIDDQHDTMLGDKNLIVRMK